MNETKEETKKATKNTSTPVGWNSLLINVTPIVSGRTVSE